MNAAKCDVTTVNEVIPLQATQAEAYEDSVPRICARCLKFFYWDLPRDKQQAEPGDWDEMTSPNALRRGGPPATCGATGQVCS